jgi:hypothetical protein
MERAPIEQLLSGMRPREIRVPENPMPGPEAPMPSTPIDRTPDPNEVMRQLVLLLLRIPGLREILLDELQKVQSGVGVANRLLDRPVPSLPPASGTSQMSFLERLRQLRGEE